MIPTQMGCVGRLPKDNDDELLVDILLCLRASRIAADHIATMLLVTMTTTRYFIARQERHGKEYGFNQLYRMIALPSLE
jgi:hypothetical protein